MTGPAVVSIARYGAVLKSLPRPSRRPLLAERRGAGARRPELPAPVTREQPRGSARPLADRHGKAHDKPSLPGRIRKRLPGELVGCGHAALERPDIATVEADPQVSGRSPGLQVQSTSRSR